MTQPTYILNGKVVTAAEYKSLTSPKVAPAPVEKAVETEVNLDEMTKAELLAWSEEQGWDLVNGQRKSEILEECRQILAGTYEGRRLDA